MCIATVLTWEGRKKKKKCLFEVWLDTYDVDQGNLEWEDEEESI